MRGEHAIAEFVEDFERQADRAAEFIDAQFDGDGWKPSEMLRIGFYALLTGPNPAKSADFANDMLEEARRRFRAGLPCNPFAKLPADA